MNRTLVQATMSAAVFAGAAGLCLLWSAGRRRSVKDRSRQISAQLRNWEGEGGSLAPAPLADSSAD